MYHFVKINNTWYLKVESEKDIKDHFNKIMRREFEDGFNDYKDNIKVIKDRDGKPKVWSATHATTQWRIGVELLMSIKGMSWLEASNELEQKTYNDRIKLFEKGRHIYLANGLSYMSFPNEQEIDEEKWLEELIYPYELNYENVRILQWPGGKHWYAKIDNIDICDKYDNYKWSSKYWAQKIAKQYCECNGDWSKIDFE